MTDNTLTFLQWNCQSLINPTKCLDLTTTLRSHQVDVALLTEVWWDTTYHPPPTFPNYTLYHNLRKISSPRQRGGGSAILVSKSITSQQFHPPDTSETVWVTLHLPSHPTLTVSSSYIPPSTPHSLQTHLKTVSQLTQHPDRHLLLTGDYNARHTTWEANPNLTTHNKHGQILNKFLNRHTLHLQHRKHPTHHPTSQHQQPSTIDLTITTPFLSHKIHHLPPPDLHSDHTPHLFTLFSPHPPTPFRSTWRIKTASPEQWSEMTNTYFQPFLQRHQHSTNPDFVAAHLTKHLQFLLDTNIQKTTRPKHRKHYPWWTKTLTLLSRARKRARRKWQHHRTPHTRTTYTDLNNQFYSTLRRSKTDYHHNLATNLSAHPLSKTNIYKHLSRLSNKHSKPKTTPLSPPGSQAPATTPTQRARVFARHFQAISKGTNAPPTFFHQHIHSRLQTNRHKYHPFCSPHTPYNSPFTFQELMTVLKNLPNTSPGPDDIPNWCLHNAGDSLVHSLLHLYNLYWKVGKHPARWKHAHVLPLPKPHRDHTLPSNYRPISLLPTLGKVLERLVYNRLYYVAESTHFLHPHQFAYRKNNSTEQLLQLITSRIQNSLNSKKPSILLTLDLHKAFDTVWVPGLCHKLHSQLRLTGRLLTWLTDFLHNRTISVRCGTTLSQPHTLQNGIPQGSVLSALLFSIYINDLPQITLTPTYLYADDISILLTHTTLHRSHTRLQKTLNIITDWANKWRLQFSTDITKSTYTIFFSKRTPLTYPKPLLLANIPLHHSPTPHLLGLNFDHQLNFKHHINITTTKATKKLNILRKISGFSWGPNRTLLLQVYKTYVLSTLTYASNCWLTSTKHHKPLQTLHNSALRLILGAHPSTPTHILSAELNTLPFTLLLWKKALKSLYKMCFLHRQHPLQLLLHNNQILDKDHKPTPLHYCRQLLQDLHLQPPPKNPDPTSLISQHTQYPPWSHQHAQQHQHRALQTLTLTLEAALSLHHQNTYSTSHKGKFYHTLRPSLTKDFPLKELHTRALSTHLFRLRTGHNNLPAHNRLTPNSNCPKCSTPHDLPHILFTCPLYTTQRNNLYKKIQVITSTPPPYTLTFLLGSPLNNTDVILQEQFLPLIVTFTK